MTEKEAWNPTDVRLGLLFLAVGVLATLLGVLWIKRKYPLLLSLPACIVGLLLLALGLNAVLKSLRSGTGDGPTI